MALVFLTIFVLQSVHSGLADTRPPVSEVWLLPENAVCEQAYKEADACWQQCQSWLELDPYNDSRCEMAREAERLRTLWGSMKWATYYASLTYGNEETARHLTNCIRDSMQEYRSRVGWQAFYQREWPPVVPWWRFERIR